MGSKEEKVEERFTNAKLLGVCCYGERAAFDFGLSVVIWKTFHEFTACTNYLPGCDDHRS